MYDVDRAAAAAFHLVLHSAGGLHIFDHVSRPAVNTVAGCSSQRNGSQHCNRVITEFACTEACYSEFPVYCQTYFHFVVLTMLERVSDRRHFCLFVCLSVRYMMIFTQN